MISGIFDSRGKAIDIGFITPDTSKYDSLVGTLEASAHAGTPATGGQGIMKDRVGTSAFIGTISVRDNGGTEKVRLGKLGTTEWGLTVYDGNIIGGVINIGSGDNTFNADKTGVWVGAKDYEDAPFRLDMNGSLYATRGEIGGFTIESDRLYGGKILTSQNVGAGAAGVIMDTAGLRGYDPVLGQVFNLPVNGDPPEFSSGVIKNTEFQLQTSSVIRTSDTVGDGTSSSAGVLINNTGLYATQANQSLANANVKILATGEAVFSGSVKGGMTDFMTGTGYFIGYSGSDYKFSIGDPAGNNMNWDGEYLRIKGSLELTSPLANVSYTTANLPVPPTAVGFKFPSGTE